MNTFYTKVTQIEPLMPSPISGKLEELALLVVRESARLGGMLHPITRNAIVELFREMNSYYSNLIEGHITRPLDIQKALREDYSKDPFKRALQQESVAHIAVQRLIEDQLKNSPDTNICSSEFLCWIHKAFYERLPQELTVVQGPNDIEDKVIPGMLRTREVQVGHHVPPIHPALPDFLNRFSIAYEPSQYNSLSQVIAAAASHHRLAWIHPFLDGNGRVVRLFSDAYFKKIAIDGHGLWTMARGLARNRPRYMAALAMADEHRRGDLDGRGNLSQKGLIFFCEFFLETAIDQIKFMSELLELSSLQKRIEMYVNFLVSKGKIKPQATYLLQGVLLQGEISRGDAARIIGMSERFARDLIKQCLHLGLLVSTTPKGPLRLGFPYEALEYYLPNLYVEVKI